MTVTFGAAKAGLLADPGADFAGASGSSRSASSTRCHGRPCDGLRPQTCPRSCRARSGGRTSTPGACSAWSPAPAHIPAPRCWPARAPWQPASAWCATWGRPTSPTWSARPAPRWCAATAPWPMRTFRPGSWAPDLDDSDEEQLQRARDAADSGLPTIADAGALPALPDVLAPQVILTPHAGELSALLQRLGADLDRSAVEASTLSAVRRAAGLTEATVLLKGATTLVASALPGLLQPGRRHALARHGRQRRRPGRSHRRTAGAVGRRVGRFGASRHRAPRTDGRRLRRWRPASTAAPESGPPAGDR